MVQSYGFTMLFYAPIVQGKARLFNLPTPQAGLSFEVSAIGGYLSLSIAFPDRETRVEEWIEEGLGRHFELVDEGGEVVFEGYVNAVDATLGGLTVRRGPLMDVANSVRGVYTPVDTTVIPNIYGARTVTATVTDATSIAKYGTFEKVVSVGRCLDTVALDYVNLYLQGKKNPASSEKLTIGNVQQSSVKLSVRGYVDFLGVYTYASAVVGDSDIDVKLKAVITADPNGVFSHDYSNVTANGVHVPTADQNDRTALTIVKELMGYGDAGYSRQVWGFYRDRKFYCYPIPTTVEYRHRLRGKRQQVMTVSNLEVKPWNVLPGKWVFILDYLIGRSFPTVLREDSRNVFIESVQYSQPWTVVLNGSNAFTIEQALAQWSLKGL